MFDLVKACVTSLCPSICPADVVLTVPGVIWNDEPKTKTQRMLLVDGRTVRRNPV